jgi:hypothetical protein
LVINHLARRSEKSESVSAIDDAIGALFGGEDQTAATH